MDVRGVVAEAKPYAGGALKILLTAPRPLIPADTGGKVRTLNIFTRLADHMEIHAISLADPERDGAAVSEMRRIFHSYTPVFWHETTKYSQAFYAEVLANQFSHLPYFVARCCLPRLRSTVEALAAREHFDLVFCDFLQTAAAMLRSWVKPRVVFEHNVEYLLRKRQWQTEKARLRKWVFGAEWKKTRRIEARVCQSFDHVITVSEEDRHTLASEFGTRRVSSIPTGVDAEFFRPLQAPPQPGRLVFVGSMDWYPNEDGVAWFLREAYPRIRKAAPHASLTIVGRNPSGRLCKLIAGEPSVELSGRVPDIRPYLASAEVVVVPLRFGGGTRIKIPEAMAMAKAIVSTRLGAEGLPVIPGREILLEEHPEGFARAVVNLLNDVPRREALGRSAREKVVREHSWEAVAAKMERILEQVARRANQGLKVTEPLTATAERTVIANRLTADP